MLHMGYSSPSVIALDYDFPFLYKKIDSIQWHTGGDMIAFISESTRLVSSVKQPPALSSHFLCFPCLAA